MRGRSPSATAATSAGSTSGRAASWTRTTPVVVGLVPVEGREPGVDGFLAARAAGDDVDDARRQPAGGRDLGPSLGAR